MSETRTKYEGVTRRSLARTIGGAAAAAILPGRSDAADPPVVSPQEIADARTETLVEAALSATPARLTPEQRLEVRRAVRDTQKTLLDVRKVGLGYDVDPATVFQAKP
jgi:hypothetical protein